MAGNKDPWHILGIPRGSSEAEIKQAYLSLAKQHHPDRNSGSDQLFKEVQHAYDTLSDPAELRKFVDEQEAAKAGPINWRNVGRTHARGRPS
jgi:curved DNA-binding protein CbpA